VGLLALYCIVLLFYFFPRDPNDLKLGECNFLLIIEQKSLAVGAINLTPNKVMNKDCSKHRSPVS